MSIKIDYFGFNKDRQYDRSNDYPIKEVTPQKIGKKILIIFLIFISIIIIGMFGFSGYIAWNSFLNDPIWLKLAKTYLAILFSPIFLFYIFLRSIVFKLPN